MSLLLILILCFYNSHVFAQDSIVLEASISEKKQLSFQEHFFDAITQKAIKNYQNAIVSLEECNAIIPKEKAVLFELSKNYLKLNKTPEALEYINEALTVDSENIWLLEHLVAIHKKDKNYDDAIEAQYKIANNYPEKKQEVVYLLIKKGDKKTALSVIEELADAKMLNGRLRRMRANLTKPKNTKPKVNTKTVEKGSLKEQFLKDKSFTTLKQLLQKLDKENSTELLEFSNQGMNLFPAQPLVYLMHGKALNKQKQFKKALNSLQNGIDFVIDDATTEKQFYKAMIVAYKGLGDTKNASKYQNKL